MSNKSYSYKGAGVDIDAGNALVEAIKPAAASTRRLGSDTGLGGFGGRFPDATGKPFGKWFRVSRVSFPRKGH